jgi:hypothetical protein
MKTIKIKGKRNIDGMNGKKKKIREKILNIDESLFKKNQVELLNKLFLEENYNGKDFIKKEVERKLNSYKNQDNKKKRNIDNFITYTECLEKLVITKLRCYYCRKECSLIYKTVREQKQWTLDRLDNSKCHSNENVVVCCLNCNLKKGTKDDKKFKFTKQMRIIKGF